VAIAELQIPPFLIPIYQAAGAQYGVPWQLLAAINWVESDFGRDLSTSSAGAVGWMQFLPSTWKTYGIDATGSGFRDPYNPVDAIFAAARYLAAAGATKNMSAAVYAYNPAGWYVQDVMARMKAIQGIPDQLTTAVAGLADGDFPVAGASTYTGQAKASSSAGASLAPAKNGTISIGAAAGSPVVAVGDGRITATGTTGRLGRYVVLADAYGNSYTYGHLEALAHKYAAPRPGATANLAIRLPPRTSAHPRSPASGGIPMPVQHDKGAPPLTGTVTVPLLQDAPPTSTNPTRVPTITVRLDVHPLTPTSPLTDSPQISAPLLAVPSTPGGRVLNLPAGQTTDEVLRPGASVAAGTILGRVGGSGVTFSITPGGSSKPLKDPAPVLNGWRLLGAASPYRPTIAAISGSNGAAASAGRALLMTQAQLERVVLGDSRVQIYACGRADVQAGRIDRRVLATLEFLADNGLDPTVTALECGHSLLTASGNVSEHATGDAVDIAAINGTSILGHQGPGSITDVTIHKLLTLQGPMKPHQIISLEAITGADNVLPLASHYNHIHIGFRPAGGQLPSAVLTGARGAQAAGAVSWDLLGQRLQSLRNPTVPTRRSSFAITDD
jgi:hypothetical protein